MNFSSLIGLIFGGVVLFFGLKESGMDMMYFVDMHGIILVFGGTLAAASISFPIGRVLSLIKIFFLRVLGKRKAEFKQTIEEILELNKKMLTSSNSFTESINSIKHQFLKEGAKLVSNNMLTENEIREILETRLKTIESRYMNEANMFKTIGKFPPAFGLLATTLGMISLLQKLGSPGAEKLIGPAMSIGLIGTLYGIALANLFFIPIAENLIERTREEIQLRKLIIEGVVLLKQQSNPVALRENLNSFLLPKDRVQKKAA